VTTWFTLFDQATGAFIATTPKPTTPTETVGVVSTETEPDLTVVAWDADSRSYVPLPPSGRTVLSRREFRRRFTWNERVAIRRAMRTHEDPDVRAELEELDVELSDSAAVEVDHADTAAALQRYVVHGLLDEARIAVILAPAPVA
jgi:hypothetical protein